MSQCEVQSGLFIKRPCKLEAKHKCSLCGINVCSRHAKNSSDGLLCVSCYNASQDYDGDMVITRSYNPFLYLSWCHYHNDRLYAEYDYTPFDESDYESFAYSEEFSVDDGGDYEGDVFDS